MALKKLPKCLQLYIDHYKHVFMKKIQLLFVAIILIGFGRAFGQQLQVSPSDTFTYSGQLSNVNDNHEQNGYIVNNTSDTTNIYWQVISATMDSSWQLSFCDPNNCYYYSVGLGLGNYGFNHFKAVPGYSNLLRFGVSPACVADSGKLVVRMWLASDSAASVQTLYYTANYTGVCLTAIQNVTAAPVISIYPNPVSSALTIDGLYNLKNVKLTVYDVLGNVTIAKTIDQPTGPVSFNTAALQSGVYFVTVDSDGSRILTKRIQKLD